VERKYRSAEKHPISAVIVKDLQRGEATAVEYKPDLGANPVQQHSAASRKPIHKPPAR
jgi:hypothetical protein